MFKKLLAVIVVVALAGIMAVPAFAQEEPISADLNLLWGSADWGNGLFDPSICQTASQTPEVQNVWSSFVGSMCGWT